MGRVLGKSPPGHRADNTRRKETWTWVSKWSDRQSFVVTLGLFEVQTCKQNFPPNIRVIGELMELAKSHPRFLQC